MNERLRVQRLVRSVAAEGGPECGAGSGRYRLLPMLFGGDGRQVEYDLTPCPLCGAEPLRLLPMKLDGDVELGDDEPPGLPAPGDEWN
jgi:hypothetical protein